MTPITDDIIDRLTRRTLLDSNPAPVEAAYHESGHATAAVVLGVPVVSVDILPCDGAWGTTRIDPGAKVFGEGQVINAAGVVSAGRVAPVDAAVKHARADIADTVTLQLLAAFAGKSALSWPDALERAESIVSDNWPGVRRLAEHLQEFGEVQGDDAIRRIVSPRRKVLIFIPSPPLRSI